MRAIITRTHHMWRLSLLLLYYLPIGVNWLEIADIWWCMRSRRVSDKILLIIIIRIRKINIHPRCSIFMLKSLRCSCLLSLPLTEGLKCWRIKRVEHASLNVRYGIIILVLYKHWAVSRVFNYLHDALRQKVFRWRPLHHRLVFYELDFIRFEIIHIHLYMVYTS